jgi:hypothetical protein
VPVDEFYRMAGQEAAGTGAVPTGRWALSSAGEYVRFEPQGDGTLLATITVYDRQVLPDGYVRILHDVVLTWDVTLVATPGGAWKGEGTRPWSCQANEIVSGADGFRARAVARDCELPVTVEVQPHSRSDATVIVTGPRPPEPGSASYAKACRTCLEGWSDDVRQASARREGS